MKEHFSQSQDWNSREHSHHQTMRRRMSSQPPPPIQYNIFAWTLFDGHAVTLERKISQKMTKNEQDQQIKGLFRKQGHVKHLRKATAVIVTHP
jgi:hypothetical protein